MLYKFSDFTVYVRVIESENSFPFNRKFETITLEKI